MSQESFLQVVERARTDRAFQTQLVANPEGALAAYDLTPEERAALLRGDPTELQRPGVELSDEALDQVVGGLAKRCCEVCGPTEHYTSKL
jgi:hypothetical protein